MNAHHLFLGALVASVSLAAASAAQAQSAAPQRALLLDANRPH